MKKAIALYGICGGLLIAALRFAEYRFLVLEHSLEIYGGIVAVVFAVVGIRLGQTLTRRDVVVVTERLPADTPFVRNDARVAELSITPREPRNPRADCERPQHARSRRRCSSAKTPSRPTRADCSTNWT